MTIRVVIADDHDIVRAGLRLIVERTDEVVVVGEARNGVELVMLLHEIEGVDVVITDLSMPRLDGFGALAAIKRSPGAPAVVIVSMHDSQDFIRRAYYLGADAYLLKDESPLELRQAMQSVLQGTKYFSRRVTDRLLQPSELSPEAALTTRQLQILTLLGQGLASKEIAFQLGLSPKTVDVHRARIMERLGIDDAVGLALYCVRHGIVDPAEHRHRS